MKRISSLFLLLILSVLLNGCIYEYIPGDDTVIVYVGKSSKKFQVNALPFFENNVSWTLNGVLQEEDGTVYIYNPSCDDINDFEDGSEVIPHILTVKCGSDKHTWEIINRPYDCPVVPDPIQLSRKQIQDTLFALYSGIGHMQYSNDDEFLYNIMFDDLNTMTSDLLNSSFYVFVSDPDSFKFADILQFFLFSISHSYSFTDAHGSCHGIVRKSGNTFTFILDADLNENGFISNDSMYTGIEGNIDYVCTVKGSYDIDLVAFVLNDFSIDSITIEANNLTAIYPSHHVTYDNWKVSYAIKYDDNPVNVNVVPEFISMGRSNVDFRDYRLSGGFSVDGANYSFIEDGTRYQQIDNRDGTWDILISDSKLIVPGFEKSLNIHTSDVKRYNSLWNEGAMIISAYGSTAEVTFSHPNTASFNLHFDGSISDTWSISNWQDALEP